MNEEKRKNFRENTSFSTRFRTIRAVLFDDDNYKFAEAVEIHYTNLSKIINGTANPFATLLLTQGADVYTVSKLLGHTSVQTTQIYARIVDKKKASVVDLLNEIFCKSSTQ